MNDTSTASSQDQQFTVGFMMVDPGMRVNRYRVVVMVFDGTTVETGPLFTGTHEQAAAVVSHIRRYASTPFPPDADIHSAVDAAGAQVWDPSRY